MNPFEYARQAQNRQLRRKQRSRPAAKKETPQRSPSQARGDQAEQRACDYVTAHGARVLARQLGTRFGEIDLVLWHQDHLVFLEVRQRNHKSYGGALASVNRDKQRRLILTAQQWLPTLRQRYFQGNLPACRFDVIAIEGDTLIWIQNAFEQS
ncbi:YraN family protein [Alcaligenes faecalis]|uniref:YraN family protein n=1 Tax=Alcaligenes faecalis TaxID=511 RepID=UPI0029329F92|nr:YraN family protein [Alcaligenes faecalis]MDV2116310.1 YraN family protein [Alcaligenes faecalis]